MALHCVTQLDQPLPHNSDAERAILGAILLDNHALNAAVERLRPEDFFLPQHRHIFEAMMQIAECQQAIDTIILRDTLSKAEKLEAAGGVAYLSKLADGLPRVTNVDYYAQIVKEKSILRTAAYSAAAIKEQALDAVEDAQVIVDRAAATFSKISVTANGRSSQERLRRVASLDDILCIADLPDTKDEYVVDRFLMRGCTTMLSGPPDKYKSWLALLMCRAIITGTKFLDRFDAQKTPIVYLDYENTGGRVRRRSEIIGLDQTNPLLRYWSKQQSPAKLGDPRLKNMAQEHRPVFVFDTLTRAGRVESENSASDMAMKLDHVSELAECGATNLILHHPPKNGDSWFRGSGDIEAFIDIGFSITETSENSGLYRLQSEKGRDDEYFGLVFEPRPWLDGTGDVCITENPQDSQDQVDASRLREYMQKNPGLSQNKLEHAKLLPEKRTRQILSRFVGKKWRVDQDLHGGKLFHAL